MSSAFPKSKRADSLSSGRFTAEDSPAGFTLVEILVVVVIIAVLATLLTAAAFTAISRAEEARVVSEMDQLVTAIELFQQKYGYPPDSASTELTRNFVAAHFPHRDPVADLLDHNGTGYDDFDDHLPAPGNTTFNNGIIDPAESLVFWLSGFSPDPKRPFTGGGARTPFFDFDKTRLVDTDNDGYPEYLPPGYSRMPYVYFDSRTYVRKSHEVPHFFGAGYGQGRPEFANDPRNAPEPYLSDEYYEEYVELCLSPPPPQQWPNVSEYCVDYGRFQIVAAGADELFGDFQLGSLPLKSYQTGGFYPSGRHYSTESLDNITSFSHGTLEDAMR